VELLPVSIGLGLAVSLMFSELFGLAAGGMVVPGYIALYLDRPLDVATTLGAGIATYAIVHTFSLSTIIYGRRRTVIMILVGFMLAMAIGTHAAVPAASAAKAVSPAGNVDLTVIGFIIPGLIAIWIDRQGLVETISVLLTASVVVRLLLVLLFGMELHA
jgi:poly-gamma-glutamate biosynthesis protein PgsC/CapC